MSPFAKLGVLFLSCSLAPIRQRGHSLEKADGLHMFLSARSSSVCLVEKALTIDVLVVNESTTDRSLNVASFRASVGFSQISTTTIPAGHSAGMSVIPDRIGVPPASKEVTLKSKETFHTLLKVSLTDPFFESPGLYRVMPSVRIGNLDRPASISDGIIFERRDCD